MRIKEPLDQCSINQCLPAKVSFLRLFLSIETWHNNRSYVCQTYIQSNSSHISKSQFFSLYSVLIFDLLLISEAEAALVSCHHIIPIILSESSCSADSETYKVPVLVHGQPSLVRWENTSLLLAASFKWPACIRFVEMSSEWKISVTSFSQNVV